MGVAMADDKRGADTYQGVCLLCGHRSTGSGTQDLEDRFFDHFARSHQSGEPIYSLTGDPGGGGERE